MGTVMNGRATERHPTCEPRETDSSSVAYRRRAGYAFPARHERFTIRRHPALYRRRRSFDVPVTIFVVWIGVALTTMLKTWLWPRTFVGLLLAFTALPAAGIAIQGLAEAAAGSAPFERLHAWLEHRTRGQRISVLRIVVCLAECLVFGGILLALVFGIARLTGVQISNLETFMDRHFWP